MHFSSMPFTGHLLGIFLQPPRPSHPHSQRLGWESTAMGCILFSGTTDKSSVANTEVFPRYVKHPDVCPMASGFLEKAWNW